MQQLSEQKTWTEIKQTQIQVYHSEFQEMFTYFTDNSFNLIAHCVE